MRRRGWTLIEMLVAVSTGTAMLALGVATLHTLFNLERLGRSDLRHRAVVSRLSQQFRDDCNAAARIAPIIPQADQPQEKGWELDLGDGRKVQYLAAEEELVRLERAGETLVGQEAFALPPDVSVSIAVEQDKKGVIAALRIAPAGDGHSSRTVQALRIEAAMNQRKGTP